MWQPDIKLETLAYPAGGVALSAYALALHSRTYPAGGVAPSSYALALHNYVQKIRLRSRAPQRMLEAARRDRPKGAPRLAELEPEGKRLRR